MLKGCLFENGLGIRLTGDPLDLTALHTTVRKILTVVVDYELQDTDTSNLLVDFLEKIERAYSGKELREKLFVQRKECTYYGFGCTWIELLMINSLLRSLSDYAVIDDLDEINMQLLEYLCRKALSCIDSKDSIGIHHYIGKRFACLNIKHFIAHFSYNNDYFKAESDLASLKKVQQYLSPYFEDNMQHN
jgi:hypothetical protein